MPSIELLTLGTVELRRDVAGEQPGNPVVIQPKSLALLIYLALAPPRGFQRRDTLVALFWPELDEARARNALNQSIHRVRSAVGGGTILARGQEEIGLDRERIRCDAIAFEDAAEAGDAAAALELYRGDFLSGFHIGGAPGFERWLDDERARLRRRARDAAETLANAAEAAVQSLQSVRWLRRVIAITPEDEGSLRRLIASLDAMGERAAAVREYEDFARRLSDEYDLVPAPESQALIGAIRRRHMADAAGSGPGGARHHGGEAVAETVPEAGDDVAVPEPMAGTGPSDAAVPEFPPGTGGPTDAAEAVGMRQPRRRAVLAATVAVALVGLTWILHPWLWSGAGRPGPDAPELVRAGDRVLVAVMENRTDDEHLGAAIREAIVTDLAQSPLLYIVELTSLGGVLERMRLPDTTTVTAGLALEIARREGYPVVVAGDVDRLGAGYQLSARVLEAATGQTIARVRETAADATGVIAAVERVARQLRQHLGESSSSIRRSPPLPQVTTASLEALELHARAREHGRRGEYRQAIALALQAVERDTAFAGAYVQLATYYNNSSRPELRDRYADLAHRHAARLPTRERLAAAADYHARRGRPDSAAHFLERLIELGPPAAGPYHALGNAYAAMGPDSDALRLYRRALELDGDWIVPYASVVRVARQLGEVEEADSVLALMETRYPEAFLTDIARLARALHLRELDAADSLAAAMASRADPAARRWAAVVRLYLAGIRGQLTQTIQGADELLRDVSPLGEDAAAAFLNLGLSASLAAGDPLRARPLVDRAEAHLLDRDGMLGVLGLAGLANGYALAGRPDAARRVLPRLDAQMDSLVRNGHARTSAVHKVRAVIAMVEGDPDAAIEELREARSLPPGLGPLGWFLWAEAHAATNSPDTAAAAYERLLGTVPIWGARSAYLGPLWPLAHERLADLYLATGDTAAAVAHLSAFAALWRDADPDLQPRVEAARDLVARLRPERRVPDAQH